MSGTKKLGIFINNTIAQLMEFTHNPTEIKTMTSHFQNFDNDAYFESKEKSPSAKLKNEVASYFRKLGDIIQHYDEIVVFGPNNIKKQLYRHLRYDKNFDKIKMDIKDSHNLDNEQQKEFVKKHFSIE